MALWAESREVLDEFIQKHLKTGVDYGSITVKGKVTKPTLFKSGSEKLLGLFGFTPRFYRDRATHEMLGRPESTVCYVCRLIDAAGQIIGEGRGAGTLGEGTTNTRNHAIKIAQKRAQVDATLRTLQLSERFTQDLEDEPQGAADQPDEGRVFGARPPDEPNENWAEDRNERELVAFQIESMRVKLGMSPGVFANYVVGIPEYGKIPSALDVKQLAHLRDRMLRKVRETDRGYQLPTKVVLP